jgi:hypothetical protein
MGKIKENKIREDRIMNEIIVDAYDAEERAMGWQAYLDDTLSFPFEAKCTREIITSPLTKNERVTVLRMADVDLCKNSMFVIIKWQDRPLGVPLDQLLPVNSDEKTLEAIKDWHYWVAKGYEF